MIQVRPKPNDRSRVQEISRNSDETFHNAIAPVLTLAQFFGVMPVCGVSSSKASAHTFKLSSFRSICTVIYIIYSSILAALNFSFFYQIGITPRNTGESHFCQAINLTSFIAVSFVLQLYSTSCFVVFLLIARDWPDLMTFWSKMEQRFLAYPYQEKPFKLNIRATAVVVIVLGFIGYVIFVSTVAYSQMKYAEIQNRTVESPLKHYLLFNYPYIFVNVPYSLPLGLFIEISTIPLIFIWNYMELFVMMICIGLVARFHQINERLDGIRGKVRHFNILTWICWSTCFTDRSWDGFGIDPRRLRGGLRTRRESRSRSALSDFAVEPQQSLLHLQPTSSCFQVIQPFIIYIVAKIDELSDRSLRSSTIFSFFLLQCIYLGEFRVDSFLALIIYVHFERSRTIVAQFIAASIQVTSDYPLEVLKAVPHAGWCIEVQRFIGKSQLTIFGAEAFTSFRFRSNPSAIDDVDWLEVFQFDPKIDSSGELS
jgi:hypothetical protein